jgi:serine/threonine protein kinase
VLDPPRRELLNQRLCLQHPHIVGLEEVFLTPYHLGIAMEYANGGDLSDYIADHVNRKVRRVQTLQHTAALGESQALDSCLMSSVLCSVQQQDWV